MTLSDAALGLALLPLAMACANLCVFRTPARAAGRVTPVITTICHIATRRIVVSAMRRAAPAPAIASTREATPRHR